MITDNERLILWNLLGFVESCKFLSEAEPFVGEHPEHAKGIRTAYGEISRSLDVTLQNCFSPQAYRALKKKVQDRNRKQWGKSPEVI